MIVRLSAQSERELEHIGDWIARDNPARAVTFIEEIQRACIELADFPERFPLVARYESQGVRHRAMGNYLIFYRVEPGKVVILHVLHGATDYSAILFPE
jgi:plasmid stabilization system protein ParE